MTVLWMLWTWPGLCVLTKGKTSTSCPNVADWLAAYEGAEQIFVATITGTLSGSYNAALLAAEEYKETHPRPVFLFWTACLPGRRRSSGPADAETSKQSRRHSEVHSLFFAPAVQRAVPKTNDQRDGGNRSAAPRRPTDAWAGNFLSCRCEVHWVIPWRFNGTQAKITPGRRLETDEESTTILIFIKMRAQMCDSRSFLTTPAFATMFSVHCEHHNDFSNITGFMHSFSKLKIR